jgi:hypothetical protein
MNLFRLGFVSDTNFGLCRQYSLSLNHQHGLVSVQVIFFLQLQTYLATGDME